MSKFRKDGKKGMPAISTASLPDIVFMLLFFFMVTTVMRETTLFVSVTTPKATEIKKLKKKSLVSYIYIGSPVRRMQSSYGTAARIQLNDAFASVDEIQEFIELYFISLPTNSPKTIVHAPQPPSEHPSLVPVFFSSVLM